MGFYKCTTREMKTVNNLNVLILEDDALDAELNVAQLRHLDEYVCQVKWVSDKAAFLKSLDQWQPDIILSDYNLPQYSGLDALNELKQRKLIIPFIFVTGAMNEETAAETIKAGAWDYVVKDRLFRLPLAIRAALQLREEKVNALQAAEQNRILSMSLAQSPVHIIISNIHGQIEFVNSRFTEITGFQPEEVIGRSFSEFVADLYSVDFWNHFWQQLQKGKLWRGEMQGVKKDGVLFWESVSVSPLKNKNDEITHFIAVKEDISQRKKIEKELTEALERAERSDKLKEAFLQNLSHEIRTPMNAIVGFSSLLIDSEPDADLLREYAGHIHVSTLKLLGIVNDILTVAKIQAGQERLMLRPVFIRDIIRSLATKYIPEASLKQLSFVAPTDEKNMLEVITTDASKLTQVLANILDNAIKFTHKGEVELGYVCEKSQVEFFVRDTGIGISTDALPYIFERFRQADPSISIEYGGNGLGLSISQSYVNLLGGTITVKSKVGVGTTFFVTMPLFVSETQV